MAEKRYTFICTLDGCHHRPKFSLTPPRVGDVITCLWCRKGRMVSERKICKWDAKCQTCAWTRSTGMVRGLALEAAESHATKRNHIVQVWSPDERLHKTVHAKGEQLTFGNAPEDNFPGYRTRKGIATTQLGSDWL